MILKKERMGRHYQRKKKWGDITKERKNGEILRREEKKKESHERKKKWKAI